ncbi:MAG: SpoIIE family protein phosphatase [Anaerolineales bacterium]
MTLLRQLNMLESAGLVRIAQLEPDLEYLFRHALVREAAYTSILSADQKELHLAVGEAIELLYPDKIDEYAAMLSYHFGEAGDTQKALKYCTEAGENALASFANQEAENHFRCALDLVEQEPERAALLYLLGEALYRQSRYDETIQTWNEGIQFYRQQDNAEGVARLYARSARASWYGGDHPEGLRLSLEGLEAVRGMDESPAKAMLIHEAARAYHFNGYPEEAEPLCREALEMAARLNAVDIQADALTTLGVLPNVPTDESLRSLERAVELAESNGLLEIAARANHNLGVITAGHSGDLKAALAHYLRSAELAQQRGAAQEEHFTLASAAGASLGLGDLKTGQEIVNRIRQIRSTFSDPTQAQLEFAGIEFGLMLLSGELQKALEILRRGRSEARQIGDLQMLHNFSTNIVDVYLVLDRIDAVDDWSEARQAAQEGIEISKRGVGDPMHSQSLLSTICVREGRLEEANKLLREARQIAGSSPSFWQLQSLLGIERDLASAQERWSEALVAAEAVSKRFAQSELRWPWAYSLIEWAETHLARGEAIDFERARALYREAIAVFEEMESEFYTNIFEKRLRALRAKSIAVTLAHDEVTQELAQAGKIQASFLPEDTPDISGWEISAILQPARETSGDFYDFIQLPGDQLGFVVADVADKGMGAALYMATCRTLIRTYAGEYPEEPELALANANRRILADTHGGLFITVFYGVIDPANGVMKYCNAGHNPPFLFSPEQDGAHQTLSRTGMPLGIIEDANWEQGVVIFNPGSLLVAYTDGITEAQNERDQFYGETRLLEAAGSKLRNPAKAVQEALVKDIQEFSGRLHQFDDMTLVVVKKN